MTDAAAVEMKTEDEMKSEAAPAEGEETKEGGMFAFMPEIKMPELPDLSMVPGMGEAAAGEGEAAPAEGEEVKEGGMFAFMPDMPEMKMPEMKMPDMPKVPGIPGFEGQQSAQEGAGVSCCDASPEAYTDVTPKDTPNGPEYLKGCTLVKMCLKKGQKDRPHEHPVHYLYVITAGKVVITTTGGQTTEKDLAPGAGMVMPAGVYNVENVGVSDVEVLFLEVRGEQQSTDTPEGHITPQETDPGYSYLSPCHYKTLAEDDHWMVVKMDIAPGAEDHPHSHKEHVVYIVDGEQLTVWAGPAGKEKESDSLTLPITSGAIIPMPGGFHVVKNSGSEHVSAMYFERKR